MHIVLASYSLQKEGNAVEENDDAFFPLETGALEQLRIRVAVCDGTTTGMLSRYWAGILAKRFNRGWEDDIDLTQWMSRVYGSWNKWRAEYLRERGSKKPIQWYEEPGLEAGAFSTLLGLALVPEEPESQSGRFTAIAVGDSCLFQVRDSSLIQKFPLGHSTEFNNTPSLVSSNPSWNTALFENLKVLQDHWTLGDRFYMMTDAISGWFLREYEDGGSPSESLSEFSDRYQPDPFSALVGDLRVSKRIHNDDVTVVCITVV